ncbi:high affinity copper uptake protein 1-like [Mya arenaria]|nr:high affinity copper uptake protein 1-like [Mya arenaria]XP_052775293.1 high affinity copper uptake protein 1-like [Mya arenaria]XP_052775294.1 high affinity copper uptake protein 1-like [Mya arenaria]
MDHSAHTYIAQLHGDHDHHSNHADHHANHADHHSNTHEYHVVNGDAGQGHAGHVDHSLHADHHLAYFTTKINATMLFEQWVLNSPGNVFLACLCTFILAIGYQGTKWFRQYLHVHWHYKGKIHTIQSKEHLLQTVLYVTEFLVSYLLMLIVMTYNVWVFLVTIIGITLGYFLLAWHKEFNPMSAAQCAETCPNRLDSKNMKYKRNPSSQELMPLDRGTDLGAACAGCGIEDVEGGNEEDG